MYKVGLAALFDGDASITDHPLAHMLVAMEFGLQKNIIGGFFAAPVEALPGISVTDVVCRGAMLHFLPTLMVL